MKNQSGMSSLKLILIIALGILLAGFVGCVASITFTGAVLKGATEALNPNNPNYDKLVKSTAKKIEPLIIEKMGQNLILNQPTYRKEIVRLNSEKAVMQARTETQSFDSVYKKPAECYDTRNSATRIKCANDYMRARAAFSTSNR